MQYLCGFPSEGQFLMLLLSIPLFIYLGYRIGLRKSPKVREVKKLKDEIKIVQKQIELKNLKKELED